MSCLERLALDNARQMMLLVDPENLRIVLANRVAWETLGLAEEDLLGKAITEVESSLPDVFYWEDVRNGQYHEIELQDGLYLCGDGSLLPVDKSVRVVAQAGRSFMLVQAHDVRLQRRIEDDLALAMSQLRATIESTGNGLLVINLQGGIASMNSLFCRMWGIPENLLLTQADAKIIDRMAGQLVDDSVWRSRLQPTVDTAETEDIFPLKDGRVFECKSRPQYLDERVIGRVFSCSDITDHIRIQRELTEAVTEAEAASRAKTRFLRTMSHELRTPMNAILGFSRLLKDQELPAQQEALARKIVDASERLLVLLDGIIDYARLEGNEGGHVQRATFDLAEMLVAASSSGFLSAKKMGLETRLDLDPGLPTHVHGDAKIIKRVLGQFISNAVKFTARGSIGLSVARMASAAEGHVCLRFRLSDTGIGIPPEIQERLFRPFTQADEGADRQFEGIGLGLALARELAHLIGGEIGVESEPGQGSTFWLELTLRVDESISPAPEPVGPQVPAPLPQHVQPAPAASGPLPDDLRATVQVLDNLLRAYDTRAGTLLAKAEPGLRPWLGERFDSLSELIESFEYDQASVLLNNQKNEPSDGIRQSNESAQP